MGWFKRGWALTRTSWNVLMTDKELLVYTALSALCTLVAAAALLLPGALIYTSGAGGNEAVALAMLFLFYLVMSFIALYFNTALTGAVLVRLRGGDPTVQTGFKVARGHLGAIAGYAAISATVGVLLYLLETKFELICRLASALLGGAWSVVTFLVVPVLVAEDCSPFEAIKRSTGLLKRTWGEQVSGGLSISGIMFLFALPALLVGALLVFTGTTAGLIAAVVFGGIYLGGLFLIGSALSQILRAAVYVYAQTGEVPNQFDGWMLRDAFKTKGRAAAA